MGMSNGGRTVLAALRITLRHPEPFVAGIALYPGCQTDVSRHFYALRLVLSGKADTMTPAHLCEQMHAAQPASAPEPRLMVSPRGPHTFDMRLPDRRILGMQLGYDPHANADARRQVVDFLVGHERPARETPAATPPIPDAHHVAARVSPPTLERTTTALSRQ